MVTQKSTTHRPRKSLKVQSLGLPPESPYSEERALLVEKFDKHLREGRLDEELGIDTVPPSPGDDAKYVRPKKDRR
jgi:hypothetical protein